MSILATEAIKRELERGAIVCDPAPTRIEGGHIDVSIGPYRWRQDPRNAERFYRDDADDNDLLFRPGFMYLCHTQEFVGTAPGSSLVPIMYGRSTAARHGMAIHLVAGLGDEGYISRWTLEIFVTAPLVVPVGARVGCIVFHRLEGDAEPYAAGTRYNVQRADWTPAAMLPKLNNW